MKKILLLTLLALCMPVITNANVASYGFAANETEKNEKDATAPKDEMPTDDDLEIMKQELLMQAYLCSEILTISHSELCEKDPNFEYAYDLYRTVYECLNELQTLMYRIEYASTMEELESCRQELDLLVSKIEQLQKDIEAFEIPYFVAVTKEGVEMTFKIISKEDKTVQVGIGGWSAILTGTIGEITIPEEVKGYRVIHIAERAFSYCSGLTSVIIPKSVTSIEEGAFYDCSNLTSVTLNSNAILSGYTEMVYLFGSQVETYIIGGDVTSIRHGAFSGCSSMTSVTIGSGVTNINNSAFFGCSNLALIVIEPGNLVYDSRDNCNAIIETGSNTLLLGCMNTIIPNTVTSIDSYAFYGCSGLTSVTIPNSVTSIGSFAFYGCSGLTSVTIPNSVTSIGSSAFDGCSGLTSVTIPNSVTSIGSFAFDDCSGLSSITFHCKEIGDSWFYNSTQVKEVIIGDEVTSIGIGAFGGCIGLTSVTIGSGVTSIGHEAFFGCSGLTSITIPISVTNIGYFAFSGCSGLTSIVVEPGNPVYDSRDNCNAIIETETSSLLFGCINTIIPNTVTNIGNSAFYGCSGLTSVTIPNSVTSIDMAAFSYCSSLTFVTIPKSVVSIHSSSFSMCSSLTSIMVESGNPMYDSRDNCNAIIETESNTLFLGCMNTIIPNTVTNIGNSAFCGCSGLTSVTIPNSVTSIGSSAFSPCIGLTSVTIGCGVTSIETSAFSSCRSLTDVYCLAENVPSTSLSSFKYSPRETATLHVPAGSIDSYKATSPWSGFGTIVGLTEDDIDGILEVESSKLKVESAAYDLSGRQIVNGHSSNGKLPRGINIIRYPNGTTRKVLVK